MFTTKQRSKLRSLAQSIEPLGQVGKGGISENMLAGLSIFPTDVTITASDHCVTLSTCNHTNYSDGRFVVHAVRIG